MDNIDPITGPAGASPYIKEIQTMGRQRFGELEKMVAAGLTMEEAMRKIMGEAIMGGKEGFREQEERRLRGERAAAFVRKQQEELKAFMEQNQ